MTGLERLLTDSCAVVLIGFGAANQAVAEALVARGHDVQVFDDRPSVEARAAADRLGVRLDVGDGHLDASAMADLIVPTPGLPEGHPAFAVADAAGTPVVSEFDLAAVWDDRPVLAITGTNGKTTSVELAVAAFAAGGRRAVGVGNTDIPFVRAIAEPATDVFVVEASSFRLSRVEHFRPDVSVWLNFAPDHLDVHRDLASYEAAKARLFSQGVDGRLVANVDDPVVMRNVPAGASVTTFGTTGEWRCEGDALMGPHGPFGQVGDLWRSLPHDVANTLAVAAAVEPFGIEPETVAGAAATFEAPAHRVTRVGMLDGQPYFDDSKATTPHATLAALRGFDEVVLIAGGRNKGVDLAELADGSGRLRAVVAIGDAADEVSEVFGGRVAVARAESMGAAVDAARRFAAGEVPVLLSPGCASFDWYSSYGERGDDFARLVRERGESS